MIRALGGLARALAYYTILPAGRHSTGEPPDVAALQWLPGIGALVGVLAGLGAYAAFAWLHVSWAFVVAWAQTIGLTGALHVDGLLDACDGLFAAVPPQRRLEILRDVRHGTFAVVGMAIVAAFWLAALAAIAPPRYPLVLAFCGAAARLAVMPLAFGFPYAATGAMARTFAARPSPLSLVLNVIFVEVLAWAIAPWALTLAPAAALVAWGGAAWASRRLGGGITGDVYGASIVVTEVLMLLALSK
ncbi:MAG: adenosylcobinamide-GDP ribazoletransferase [Candidatus Tumulicola sp.]